jgi:hypothetical protein
MLTAAIWGVRELEPVCHVRLSKEERVSTPTPAGTVQIGVSEAARTPMLGYNLAWHVERYLRLQLRDAPN